MKKKRGIILLSIALASIIIVILSIWQKNVRKEKALEECKNEVETLCSEYGIVDVGVKITYSRPYDKYAVYLLRINGTFTDVSMADIYQLVKAVDLMTIAHNDTLLLKKIILNSKEYKLGILNEKELTCDDAIVYTYVSTDDKKMRGELKEKLPYVGMREEFLEYTLLGTADSVEKCRDFNVLQARARYKTYEWEATNEHGWYEITVEYRMHRSHRFDDYIDLPTDNGYVSRIYYKDKNGMMQTEEYIDTL